MSPCGMVMDILRSHHLAPTQILSDSSAQTWVRWYPCAPGARAYPGWHAFGSPVWESDFPVPDGVGCYPAPLVWRGKRYPAPPGQHYRGLPEWFQYGLPAADLSAPPISDTCQAPAISPIGGVLLGGSAWPAVPIAGPAACLCAGPITRLVLPATQAASAWACAAPATALWIGGSVSSAACVCHGPSTGVVTVIQSCVATTLISTTINDMVLPPTSTPLTKYDITPASGGTTITGIVPQSLATGPQWITVCNVGLDPLTIVSSSSSSASANRVVLPPTYFPSVTLGQYDTLTLSYDPCGPTPEWVVQACTVDLDDSLATILAYVEAHYTPTITVLTGALESDTVVLTGAYQTLACSVALTTGTWVIVGDLQVQAGLSTSPGSLQIDAQLWDGTAGAAVPNSQVTVGSESLLQAGVSIWWHGATVVRVDASSGSRTISWQARISSSTPGQSASAIGDASGIAAPTRLVAIKTG